MRGVREMRSAWRTTPQAEEEVLGGPRPFTAGTRLIWHGRDVEVTDVAVLGPGWRQVVIRCLDRPHRPSVSLTQEEFVDGLAD